MIDDIENKLSEIDQKLKRVKPYEVDGLLKDILFIFGLK